MKKIMISILFFALVLTALPAIIITFVSPDTDGKEEKSAFDDAGAEEVFVSGDYNFCASPDLMIRVYINERDETVEMKLDDYIKGVLPAEMPPSFNIEALKAQAVAARTYVLAHKQQYEQKGYPPEHKGNADACTNYKHCKAWVSEDDAKARWQDWDQVYKQKIDDAVTSTANICMVYNDEPIVAVFHSTSSGVTESAKDVWGSDVPYLQSVESEGDVLSPKYNAVKSVSMTEFMDKVQAAHPDIDWTEGIIGEITRSDAGGILTIKLGNQKLSGTELRELFGLQSVNAQLEISEDAQTVTITTKGNGHGVGMSQYGANYMAEEGKSYIEILKSYYTNVELAKVN